MHEVLRQLKSLVQPWNAVEVQVTVIPQEKSYRPVQRLTDGALKSTLFRAAATASASGREGSSREGEKVGCTPAS